MGRIFRPFFSKTRGDLQHATTKNVALKSSCRDASTHAKRWAFLHSPHLSKKKSAWKLVRVRALSGVTQNIKSRTYERHVDTAVYMPSSNIGQPNKKQIGAQRTERGDSGARPKTGDSPPPPSSQAECIYAVHTQPVGGGNFQPTRYVPTESLLTTENHPI